MVREGLAKFVKSLRGFLAALSHSKKAPPRSDPRKAIRRTLLDATHVANTGGIGGGTGGAATGNHASGEKILGQVISDGYKQRR